MDARTELAGASQWPLWCHIIVPPSPRQPSTLAAASRPSSSCSPYFRRRSGDSLSPRVGLHLPTGPQA
eukprot:13330888-Alexandrium_andersonii.AAC.1